MTKMKSCWPWPSSWASLSTTSEGLKNPSASSSPLKSSRPSKRPSFETRCAYYEASFVRLLSSVWCSQLHSHLRPVRHQQQSVESLCKVADVLPEADFVDHFVPLIKRLATGDWFTARTSGCGLFAKAYSRLTGKLILRMASQL